MTGAIFRALPDAGAVPVISHPITGFYPVWPNCIVVPDDIIGPIAQRASIYWFPPGQPLALNSSDWIINLLADADEYYSSLNWLQGLDAAKAVPIFNHPEELLKTRRDIISESLVGVPNLIVPKSTRFEMTHMQDLNTIFERDHFRFPVLVRPAASQAGQGLVKIDSPDQWHKVLLVPRRTNIFYMTQFVEHCHKDGLYRKVRVTLFGDHFHVRHVKFDRQWNVHNSKFAKDMVDEEMALIKELNASENLKFLTHEIMKRIKLDYWGLDLGFRSDDDPFLFFEGNAAMSMVPMRITNELPRSSSAREKQLIGLTVRDELKERLQNVASWCSNDICNFSQRI